MNKIKNVFIVLLRITVLIGGFVFFTFLAATGLIVIPILLIFIAVLYSATFEPPPEGDNP